MIPVAESKLNPVGKLGEIEYSKTVPPETVGDKLVIASLIVNTFGDGYVKLVGATSITAIDKVNVVFPPELIAVTV